MARPKRALLRGAVALLCASACAVRSGAADPCANRNTVDGVATDGTDATAQWANGDNSIMITGCNNTLSNNTVGMDSGGVNFVRVLGSNNVVRSSVAPTAAALGWPARRVLRAP
jgi:hypothetical protein